MVGTFLIFLTRCITPAEAYRSMNWSALILISCMLALGKAMEVSGLATYLAGKVVLLAGTQNPKLLLAGFFLLSMILHPAYVQSGRCSGGFTDCDSKGVADELEPTQLRHDDCHRRGDFVHYTARAGLYDGLWPWKLSLYGFRQSWLAAHGDCFCYRYVDGPRALAVLVSFHCVAQAIHGSKARTTLPTAFSSSKLMPSGWI
jgi:Di- and tricarboxylate transporters